MAEQTPTREQFEAASKKVMASAPEGLSREQFFALIDKEIATASRPPINMFDRKNMHMEEVEHEPDTFWGGFGKSIKDQLGNAFIKNNVAQQAAHPQTVADFLSFLLPTAVPVKAAQGFKILGRAAVDASDEAKAIGLARNTSSIREYPKQLLTSLKKYYNMPEAKGPEAAAARFTAHQIDYPTEGVAPSGSGAGNPEAWREFAGSKGPGPEPFTDPNPDWHPQDADPEAWRREPMPGPEPFHPVEGGEGNPGAWRNEPRSGGPLTVEPTSQTDRVPAGNPDAVPAPSPRSAWPPEGAQGDWHSGAESGSPEAARAQGLHRDTGELDARYRTMTQDTRDALLAELMRTLKP